MIDLDEIKEKLIEKLKPTGWAIKLKGFIQSSEFDSIIKQLYDLREEGKRFTPPLKRVFRAFEECPLDNLKVVIIGQDPYFQIEVADGIGFSCGISMKPQPSLKEIFKEIERTVAQGFPVYQDPDLKRWANQGVLLLNSALTCQIDKPGTHYGIWNDFVMYTIDMLNLTNAGLIFILLGKKAQELEQIIGPQHHVLKANHPASAGYTGKDWDCNNIFNETNRLIKNMNGSEFQINWY
jgi:uracil-DNA glycosylase